MSWYSSIDWGALIGAAASYHASDKAADAAKDAGKTSQAGSAASNDVLREFYNRDEQRNLPFYNNSLTAQAQYMKMLGLTPSQGGATMSQGGGTTQMPSEWFQMKDGAPTVNGQLYGSDPRYKSAWDQATLEHRSSHDGREYGRGSDRGAIRTRLQQLYGQGQTPGTQTQAPTSDDPYAGFRNAPGYQWQLDQGQKGLAAKYMSQGGYRSGAHDKALLRYSQGMADQSFGDYMNRVGNVANMGQVASQQMGAAGQAYGGQMASNITNGANNRAQSIYAAGQARNQGYADAFAYGNQAYRSWQNGRG